MKTFRNAMVALEMIAASDQPVSVAEVGKRLDLPRSSASRLMASLRSGDLIEQDPATRRYTAGPLAWRLGIRYRPIGYDADLLADALVALSHATGLTSWMAVLNGTEIVLLRQHQGQTPVLFSVRLGQTLPAHATAIGKALLSRLPDEEIERLYGDTLARETEHTIASRAELIEEVHAVRDRGYALSRQEAFPGIISIGGAVFGSVSSCPIGLSLSFPEKMGDPERIAAILTATLQRIGTEIGDPFWQGREAMPRPV
ncbi:IclR family transcriptional regulator [Oceanibacterium hippocampi]|uniref:HTH-type transcriptional repressor AllR n=1 Tax=Oceanibacterium hippocampi TaxID=745714 RepID=A0A1Y5TWD9_9PROT|nr:IclR family transcriptional regulator [Oceanibacterium hippocampi]SLN75267.1 HTH-type transcriptional repressor AllR [Oceanibacterium hippocampi]